MASISSVRISKGVVPFAATADGFGYILDETDPPVDIFFQGRTENFLRQFQSSAFASVPGPGAVEQPCRIVSIVLQPLVGVLPAAALTSTSTNALFANNPLQTLSFDGGQSGILYDPINLTNGVRIISISVQGSTALTGNVDLFSDLTFIFD